MVEDNGFEPFAPGCKPGVLAKYTNPPNDYFLTLNGAPRQNRTAITGLQNQCTTIVLVGLNS